jgi:ABC-2 type transport system permease protein
MRDFLTVFTKSHKFLWSDVTSVLVFTLFPIVLIFVLGQALGSFMDGNFDLAGDTIPIVLTTDSPDSPLAAFLLSEEIAHFLDTQIVDDSAVAIAMLKDGEVALAVVECSESGEIAVSLPEHGGGGSRIAMSMIESFNQVGAAMTISAMSGADMSQLATLAGAEIPVTQSALGNRTANATDFFAVTMLLMFMLYAGENGMQLFKKSMFGETGGRMLTTPVSKFALTGGLLTAATVATFLQGMVILLFTWFVYGVYWGERIGLVLVTIFAMVLFAQAFAIFLFTLFKKASLASVVMQFSLFMMVLLSGGFGVPLHFTALEGVIRYIPNSLAQTVMFGSMFGGNESRMFGDLTLLFVYSGVLFILAYLLGRRKLA